MCVVHTLALSEQIHIASISKLVCTLLNYRVLETVALQFFFQMIILSMHLYTSDECHAWFHLYGTSRPARSASKAKKCKMKNSCSQWDRLTGANQSSKQICALRRVFDLKLSGIYLTEIILKTLGCQWTIRPRCIYIVYVTIRLHGFHLPWFNNC